MIKRNGKRHKSCQMVVSTLVCPKCKNKITIWRQAGNKRAKGHLKKLYCYKCKRRLNHKELGEYGDKYD